MPRSVKKGFYVAPSLKKKIDKAKEQGEDFKGVINTKSRSSMITPEMVGLTIGVHNGRTYISVVIRAEMVERKLGEFSITRTRPKHPTDRKTG